MPKYLQFKEMSIIPAHVVKEGGVSLSYPANSLGFGLTIGIRAGSAISCVRAHLGGVGPKPSEPWV
jgi:hypothetical protein